ncbi:integrase [Geoglobus acetivorans]|uniref:Integrase SSV1 C-terminal domain-containing protein n=1 Tax=Geoglobus acetivorans TaxID=565033 RepID=A0A0A7GGA7_GEOAI|nr:hypothetical protein GACE_2091 [Geoglobus acetivorans]
MLRPGFEPGSPARKAWISDDFIVIDYQRHRNEFIEWLQKKSKKTTWQNYVTLLDRKLSGVKIFDKDQLAEIYDELERNKANFAKGVRNFLNFLVEKKGFPIAVAEEFKSVLKIPRSGTDKQIPSDTDIIEAHEYFRSKLTPELLNVFYLLIFSGLRLEHILQMLRNFNPARLEILDSFARYDMSGIGSENKDAYECYMPVWLAKRLSQVDLDYRFAKDSINYKAKSGKTISAKYIRKWTNNFLKKQGVPKDERNFILGRHSEISKSVENFNYLDLRDDADMWYARVVDKFPIKEVEHAD